jgi:hypothetical protein
MTKRKKSRWMDTEDDEGKSLPEKTEEYEHRPAYGRTRRQYEGKHGEPMEIDTRHADFGDLTVNIYDDQDQAAYEPPDMNLEQAPAPSLPGGLKVPERAKRYVDSVCPSAPACAIVVDLPRRTNLFLPGGMDFVIYILTRCSAVRDGGESGFWMNAVGVAR